MAQGYSVKLDGIGIFYPTIANVKGGAESPADFSLTQNVKGVRFKFRPDRTHHSTDNHQLYRSRTGESDSMAVDTKKKLPAT